MQRRIRRYTTVTGAAAVIAAGLLGPTPAVATGTASTGPSTGTSTGTSTQAGSRIDHAGAHPARDRRLRINQVQVIGTHNSYHLEATPAESALRALVSPEGQKALEYSHPPLRRQFGRERVRQIELDIWADPDGGLYADPLLRELTGGGPYDPAMRKPGTKVLHIQDIDYHSNCLTFLACLRGVRRWSDAHPSHLPIAVLVEFKDTPLSLTDLQTARLQRAAVPATGAAAPATPAAALVTPLPWTAAR